MSAGKVHTIRHRGALYNYWYDTYANQMIAICSGATRKSEILMAPSKELILIKIGIDIADRGFTEEVEIQGIGSF